MKKSEMIKKIDDLRDWYHGICTDQTLGYYIIHMLEREGMLPPAYEREMREWTTVKKYWVQRWEPEDV
jgi:hypothetical protein